MMADVPPTGTADEQPRTRSRKRAEALAQKEESAQKRAKEEREKAVKLGMGGMAKTVQKPGKRVRSLLRLNHPTIHKQRGEITVPTLP
jgi:hypothetical protein